MEVRGNCVVVDPVEEGIPGEAKRKRMEIRLPNDKDALDLKTTPLRDKVTEKFKGALVLGYAGSFMPKKPPPNKREVETLKIEGHSKETESAADKDGVRKSKEPLRSKEGTDASRVEGLFHEKGPVKKRKDEGKTSPHSEKKQSGERVSLSTGKQEFEKKNEPDDKGPGPVDISVRRRIPHKRWQESFTVFERYN